MSDPFWKRTGFWASTIATVPLGFAIYYGHVTQELVIAVLGAWAGYLTAQQARGPVGPIQP